MVRKDKIIPSLTSDILTSIKQKEEGIKGRKARERQPRSGLVLVGTVGWSIVIPAAVGLIVGKWLDKIIGNGVMWAMTLFILGLSAGLFNVWRTLNKEIEARETTKEKSTTNKEK